mmetsp:Transcript_93594/g.166519  ORF Transcript_93594/g.166519 Transcript_93594/m.166519 type:complete len:527 (+) Transcript_93594:66-1646(+)
MAPVRAGVALSLLSVESAAFFSDNPFCIKNKCVNPIFPGLESLHELSEDTWYCTDIKDTAGSLDFCKGAVNYAVAVPQPESKAEESIGALVRKMDSAANTAYVYHLAGLGMTSWDYEHPESSDDECVKSIWKMACYTYFPRAKSGCAHGEKMDYIRPCKSSCENYIKSCKVECCDESVQCVFRHEKKLTETTVLVTEGYEPHDGPSTMCTGAAQRAQRPGLLGLLIALFLPFAVGEADGLFQELRRALPGAKSVVALGIMVAVVSLQGCDAALPSHPVGNWRMEDDYLARFQFVPPGTSSKEALLNSCSMPGLAPTAQCSGHGGCHVWHKSEDSNPTPFCRCEASWADPECRTKRKSQTTAFFLSVFFGFFGADRFYLGLIFSAWCKLITLGILSVYWITEVLIYGYGPLSQKDLQSWAGLLKIVVVMLLSSWYFIDVVRTGSGPVQTSGFRTAPDLPRAAFVACTVFCAMGVGFLLAGWSILQHVGSRRKNLWLMQQAYTQEKHALDEGVMTGGSREPQAVYGSI